jgi:hypothetical protein
MIYLWLEREEGDPDMHRRDYPTYNNRHQQQPAVTNEPEYELIEYRVNRLTEFGEYIALVQIDQRKRKQYILVFDREPVITAMFGLIKIDAVPIKQATVGALTDIHSEITRMIVDWEIPLWSKEVAENVPDPFLAINYQEEIKKRRTRLQATTTEDTTTSYNYEAPIINDFFDAEQQPEKTPEQIKAEQIQEIADRTGRTVAQVSNLAQFRDSKKLG